MNLRRSFSGGLFVLLIAPLTCRASDSPSTVPMQLLGNFPVVAVNIDGDDVPLMFDLGDASSLVLQQSVIDRLKTVPTGETLRFKDAMGNIIHSPIFKIPNMKIGGAVFNDVMGRLDAHDLSYQTAQVGQQGSFGRGIFKSYKIVLDYHHRKMTLIPPGSTEEPAAMCKGTVVPILPDWQGEPVTKGRSDFGDMTLIWDTGIPTSAIRKNWAQQVGAPVTGESVITKHFLLGGVDFGPLKLTVFDYTEPSGTDAFVGYNFFAKHVVCIDFPANRFLVQR